MKSTGKISALIAAPILTVVLCTFASAQRDQDQEPDEPTATLNFIVLKQDNGKPVRNAAVIMHSVNAHGKQSRGDLELKTDQDGKTSFDGVPYGKLRVQVLASGFQTFGEDYEVNQAAMSFTIKLNRPQGQYSIYGNQPDQKKDPPDPNAKPQ
jgi:hypothetical protein